MNLMLVLSIIGAAILTLFFVWLTRRAWRAQRVWIKWPGAILAGLLTVIGLALTLLPLAGIYRMYGPQAAAATDLQIVANPEQLDRGERLAIMCVGCHSSTGGLPLDGADSDMTEGILGALYPPNLTPGGPLQTWIDGEIIRAIREGIHQSGRSLLLMPSEQYHAMSDDDVQALVAYLRSQPAADRQQPATEMNLLGAALVGAGIFPISRQAPIVGTVAAPTGATAEHGAYLVSIGGCESCHGEGLRGGTSQFTPIGPNLPAIVGQWEAEQFVATIRTGVDPYGANVNPELMPWPGYSTAFTDEELTAIYTYIRTLPIGTP